MRVPEELRLPRSMIPLAAVVGAPRELEAITPVTRLRVETLRAPDWIEVLPVYEELEVSATVPPPVLIRLEEPESRIGELPEISPIPSTAFNPAG